MLSYTIEFKKKREKNTKRKVIETIDIVDQVGQQFLSGIFKRIKSFKLKFQKF